MGRERETVSQSHSAQRMDNGGRHLHEDVGQFRYDPDWCDDHLDAVCAVQADHVKCARLWILFA
jgi:hypothetical protein